MSKLWIKRGQQVLKITKVYNGKIDGDFGEKSYNAVVALAGKAGIKIPVSVDADKFEKPFTPMQAPKPISGAQETNPLWIDEAYKYLGVREIKGKRHNLIITSWYNEGAESWFTNDEIPWCGKFIAQCLSQGNRTVPKHWYRALAYLDYGTKLTRPAYGSIGVKKRKGGGGHVTFIVGRTTDGYLVGLGGNQSDMVKLTKFKPSDFEAYIWASDENGLMRDPYPTRYDLPLYGSNLSLSTKES